MRFSISTFLFVPLLTCVVLSCAAPESRQIDIAKIRRSIVDVEAKFTAAFNRGDVAGVAALYTDDATLLPPNSETLQGRQAIQDFWTGGLRMGLKDVTLTTVDVGGSDDTAYSIGKYTLNIQPEGQEGMSDSGKYVVVWKRQADGTWKYHVDIWNSSMPMPGQ